MTKKILIRSQTMIIKTKTQVCLLIYLSKLKMRKKRWLMFNKKEVMKSQALRKKKRLNKIMIKAHLRSSKNLNSHLLKI